MLKLPGTARVALNTHEGRMRPMPQRMQFAGDANEVGASLADEQHTRDGRRAAYEFPRPLSSV